MWLLVLFSAVVNASGRWPHAMTTVRSTEARCTAAKNRLAVGSATIAIPIGIGQHVGGHPGYQRD